MLSLAVLDCSLGLCDAEDGVIDERLVRLTSILLRRREQLDGQSLGLCFGLEHLDLLLLGLHDGTVTVVRFAIVGIRVADDMCHVLETKHGAAATD